MKRSTQGPRNIVYLSGGVGGARLLRGLVKCVAPERLTVITNTADDFVHLGLHISPDLDTLMYTLAGVVHPERGWGLADESFDAMGMVERMGGPTWFSLSDQDLGTHLVRTEALARGETLTEVTGALCARLGVATRLLPMSDARATTIIETEHDGDLPFQTWFVERRTAPRVRRVRLDGGPAASPQVLAALDGADAVLIGPSNPYVSIDPILLTSGVLERVAARPTLAVSPIIGGKAVKGPLAEMIGQLAGEQASPGAVARHYGSRHGLSLEGFVVEHGDEPQAAGFPVHGAPTVMGTQADSEALASVCIGIMDAWNAAT